MRRWVVGCLVVVLLVGGVTATVDIGPLTSDAPTTTGEPATPEPAVASPGIGAEESASLDRAAEFDRTRFRIEVFTNGSARWQFRYVRNLGTNDTERERFADFAERFNTEETDLYRDFVDRANSLTASAADATGREMTARNFSREARVEQDVEDLGVVEMEFTWVAFAAVDGDRVIVGDVFDGGLFLGSDKSLVIATGPELQFESIDPEGTLDGGSLDDSAAVTWQGERDFASGRPRVVLEPPSATTEPASTGTTSAVESTDAATTTDAASTATKTSTLAGRQASTGDGVSAMLLGLGALVLLAGAGAAVWARGRGDVGGGATAASTGDDGGPGSVTEEPSAESAGDPAPAVQPEELLSDEDRVVNMLEERGGRMRQVQIVEETEWSKSKVSMLLSDMEDEGTISKLRVGRENIISLEGEEPEAAGSPFEGED